MYGISKKGNSKQKSAVKRSDTAFNDLSKELTDHGRHSMLSFLSFLPFSEKRIIETELIHSTIGITNCTMLHSRLDVILNMLSGHLSILKQITKDIS